MKILLISGAGLIAGTNLYNYLIKKIIDLGVFYKDSDYPEIILHNHPFKGINEYGEINYSLAKDELESIVSRYPNMDSIIIACNTLHLVKLDIPNLLNVPQTTINYFEKIKKHNKKGLVLCSKFSRENNLFENNNLHYLPNNLSIKIDEIIKENIAKPNHHKKESFTFINEYISENNITHLIIGCTELSIMNWSKFVSVPVLDTGKLAIESLVFKILKMRG